MEYLVLLGVGVVVGFFIGKSMVDDSEAKKLEKKELEFKRHQQQKEMELTQYHEHRESEFRTLLNQAQEFRNELSSGMLAGRQWLAKSFAEFVDTRNKDVECWLAVKPHPALKASEHVSEIRKKHREAIERLKLLEYQLDSYEEYFPFLLEYRDAILDESIDLRKGAEEALDSADPALSRGYLSKEEYEQLSTVEKFQLALDRYWKRDKSKLEIGRVYERFLGYLYEHEKWRVTYQGIIKGREDFGRDLICSKDGEIHIVQCKCWSKNKVIREKHIFQLYGTTVLFELDQLGKRNTLPNQQLSLFNSVTAVFATTTELSSDALAVSDYLHISIRQEPLRRYPMIKCNINPSSKERIYHLPFDQQYDKIVVGNIDGEFFAETVEEAEKAGFRRAFRWQGNKGNKIE